MGGIETDILNFIKHFLTSVGYPGVFALMMIEGFGVPIPSEVTMPFSGFLATAAGGNKFTVPTAILVGAVGEVTGSVIAYWLGYLGGRPVLERYGRVILVSTEELEKAERWFGRYGDWVVIVTRLLPAARGFVPLPAGVVRMPFWRFFAYIVVGSAVWCTVLTLIGHALGQHWNTISNDLRQYDVIIIVLVVLLIVFVLFKRLQHHRRDQGSSPVAESKT